jgi:hypothetical protein
MSFDRGTGEVRFSHPRLPDFLDHVVIRGLRAGASKLDIMLRRYGNDVSINVLARTGEGGVVVTSVGESQRLRRGPAHRIGLSSAALLHALSRWAREDGSAQGDFPLPPGEGCSSASTNGAARVRGGASTASGAICRTALAGVDFALRLDTIARSRPSGDGTRAQIARGESRMDLDPVLLSRVQFFWVIALHILLPAFTSGSRATSRCSRACTPSRAGRSTCSCRSTGSRSSQCPSARRRVGHRHAVPVRHQLEPVLGIRGGHHRAAARL